MKETLVNVKIICVSKPERAITLAHVFLRNAGPSSTTQKPAFKGFSLSNITSKTENFSTPKYFSWGYASAEASVRVFLVQRVPIFPFTQSCSVRFKNSISSLGFCRGLILVSRWKNPCLLEPIGL